MKRSCFLSILVVIAMSTAAFASGSRDIHSLNLADHSQPSAHYGAPITHVKADTFFVYGGPGTLEGKFQDSAGNPSWGEEPGSPWTHIDNTQRTESKWHIDTYNAENIGGGGPGNHAWWCGELWESCGPSDDPEGYGNNYLEFLDWTGHVADPLLDTDVTITFEMEYDSEPGYDGTSLQYRDQGGMVEVMYWDGADTAGQNPAWTFDFTLTPDDYAGSFDNEVLLRFEFESDGGWSDEDCSWPTQGAVQIDDIAVYFDQGSGGVLQGTVEDCEGKAPPQWEASMPPGVGDYAKVWPSLDDLDPCRSNHTPVVAFIDDGIVVPGTGGTMCITWCYGPFGYTINPQGGLAGPDKHLDNYILSPAIEWDPDGVYPDGCDGAGLAFDVYSHADLTFEGYDGSFYIWGVGSSLDGGVTWGGWQDLNLVYYGGPGWYRRNFDCSAQFLAGKTHVRIQLGVYQLGWVWGFDGIDASPAPYFDNVQLKAYTYGGPAISTREIDMLQDGFPAIGDIDGVDLSRNSIRVDQARDLTTGAPQYPFVGDTMTVDIVPVRNGAVINQTPRMYYKFKTNPLFDGVRAAEFSASGYVEGDSVRNTTGAVVAEKWAFELPDTGWLFPGDYFHWYIEAYDDVSGDIGTSRLPADTTGFSSFGNPLSYNSSFVVHGLPTLFEDDGVLETPDWLFWNDFANRGGEAEWYTALDNLGFKHGQHYDIYYTNGPSSGVGNGLGGRASVQQIEGYDHMLYTCGNLSTFTITNIDYDTDPGDDLGLLDSWLRLGNKNLALFGDDLVYDLDHSPQGAGFISDWLGVTLLNRDLSAVAGNQTAPTVVIDEGNSVFGSTTEWVAYGGCLGINTFDAVEVTTGERLAHFLDPAGDDTYDYSAATLNYVAEHGVNVISFPYGFSFIYNPDKAPLPSARRTQLLEEVIIYFHTLPGPVPSDIPSMAARFAGAAPNPFNPKTEISWRLPEDCKMSVKVFNVRGNLVRTLVDNEERPGVGSVTWSGDNNNGAKVASGVYFAKVSAPEFTKTIKIALVK